MSDIIKGSSGRAENSRERVNCSGERIESSDERLNGLRESSTESKISSSGLSGASDESETIVAVSTPLGGAVAIIRLSGERSKEIAEKLCNRKLDVFRRSYFAAIDTGVIKDKCVVIIYEAGRSYTGETVCEICCHGSAVIAREIVDFCIKNGARGAEKGEFTRRAYLNKRLDLTEAEGVLDLINAETVEQAKSAYDSVDGKLRRKLEALQGRLKSVIARVDVAIDYPEEDIEAVTKASVEGELNDILSEAQALTGSYKDACALNRGVKVVILGKPNVGKSELFNAIVGKKRAIVSRKEGTTRDFIESDYVHNGRKFVLVDTAGIRDTHDEIESEGIACALEEAKGANLILGVGVSGDEFDENCVGGSVEVKLLRITNKCDVSRGKNFNVSAKEGIAIDELKDEIYRLTDFSADGLKLSNLRQYRAVSAATEHLGAALRSYGTLDCFAADLMCAYDELGKVTGVIGSDEVIAEIFSAFCVGK